MAIRSEDRANGTDKMPQTNGDALHRDFDIPMRESYAWTPQRKLNVVTVGAGFSGLILAHKLQHQHPEMQTMINHTIYECRGDIGGTWLVNRYPGVQCDIPAHIYVRSLPGVRDARLTGPAQAFPFDPKPDWPRYYATGPEIHAYMKSTTKKWNLDRDVRLNHRVTEAVWQEDAGQWKITVETASDTFVTYADVLISGQGVLK